MGARTRIVVPCYNEAPRLDTARFDRYLGACDDVDLLLVNDGSTDATAAVLDELAGRWPGRVEALHLERNGGKAEAVRRGVVAAMSAGEAAHVGFWDADLATPLESIQVFVDVLDRLPRVDVVLGSRVQLLGRRIERKASRRRLGRLFAATASLVLDLPVRDTQCGAKLFRVGPRTRRLFAEPFLSRWIFDVELLARYLDEGGDGGGIYELPVDQWEDVGGSKVRPADFVRAIGEMAQIFRVYRQTTATRRALALLTAPFIRYTGVGAIGTLIHYLILITSVEWLGASAPIGAALGATGGAFVNYWLNYHFTFVSARRHRETLSRFLVVAALGIGLSWLLVRLATDALGIHYFVGQLAATLAVLVLGYLLNRSWTFRVDAGREGSP
ncbi:MAG: GtrA family protein [Myxococcales bacterium]|nr:GtrA family protein [Myxococcales bacterium]MCB9705133.1 GtrA family protein [Myxococcales bacterium]